MDSLKQKQILKWPYLVMLATWGASWIVSHWIVIVLFYGAQILWVLMCIKWPSSALNQEMPKWLLISSLFLYATFINSTFLVNTTPDLNADALQIISGLTATSLVGIILTFPFTLYWGHKLVDDIYAENPNKEKAQHRIKKMKRYGWLLMATSFLLLIGGAFFLAFWDLLETYNDAFMYVMVFIVIVASVLITFENFEKAFYIFKHQREERKRKT